MELNLLLEGDVFVEGSHLRGLLKIGARKRTPKEAAVRFAEGKLRVIGFENINGGDKHIFYHHVLPLSDVTDSLGQIFSSEPDSEGFAEVQSGIYTMPFGMLLPLGSGSKGSCQGVKGVSVRYIALVYVLSIVLFTKC